MAKEYPYFKWYPKDAEADERYAAMTDTELGFFHRCLNRSWMNEGLPADPEERSLVLKTPIDLAAQLWRRVGRSFVPSDQFPGKLVNPRQEIERVSAQEKRRKATNSANSRHHPSQTQGNGKPPDITVVEIIAPTPANGSANEHANGHANASNGEVWFEEVYIRHPKKKDRGIAAQYLSQVTVERGEFDRVHKLWCAEWAKEKANFAPSLAQWILDKGWKYPPAGNGNGSIPPSTYKPLPVYEPPKD